MAPVVMRTILNQDTIVAIATPQGPGAIGIVRISGSDARCVLGKIWNCGYKDVDKWISTRIYYGNIVDNRAGIIVDEVLSFFCKSPHSYTGEDVVEIQTHGNPLILDRIVGLAVSAGARVAEPGEFTRRAYLNGRIDLAQAEAVADLIHASSHEALVQAHRQLGGLLSGRVRGLLSDLTTLRSLVEASIDFPEEDIAFLERHGVQQRLVSLAESLRELLASASVGRLYREGAEILLVGPPNAGKSSLMNALLGEVRAIVHASAGTTRDPIGEHVVWDGIPIVLTDSAGLRVLRSDDGQEDDANAVERIGIERTQRLVETTDLRILVVDGGAVLSEAMIEGLAGLPREHLLIWCNKGDLPQQINMDQLSMLFPEAEIYCGSAMRGDGLDALRMRVVERLRGGSARDRQGAMLTNRRHQVAVERALLAIDGGRESVASAHSSEFVAEHLREASEALGSIVGDVTTEQLLGEIFGRFCIGK